MCETAMKCVENTDYSQGHGASADRRNEPQRSHSAPRGPMGSSVAGESRSLGKTVTGEKPFEERVVSGGNSDYSIGPAGGKLKGNINRYANKTE